MAITHPPEFFRFPLPGHIPRKELFPESPHASCLREPLPRGVPWLGIRFSRLIELGQIETDLAGSQIINREK